MGIESDKPMHRSLLTPGREDLSPLPPVGQLDFGEIITMDEAALDGAFRERHGLGTVFKENASPALLEEGRRLEVKKMILARLEGYSIKKSTEIDTKWKVPENLLPVFFVNNLTSECRQRITEVRRTVASEAMLHAPTPNLRNLYKDIQKRLRELNVEELSLRDIFSLSHLPPHKPGKGGKGIFDIEFGLKYFLLRIQGNSVAQCAEKLHVEEMLLKVTSVRYFSPEAKEILSSKSEGTFSKPLLRESGEIKEDKRLLATTEDDIPDEATARAYFSKLQEELQKTTGEMLPKEAKLLEIGTGTGALLRYLRKQGYDIVGVDGRPHHRGSLPIVAARIERLPFKRGVFDAIISSGVFDNELYEQRQGAMVTEMRRVLKPGGLYISILDHSNRAPRGMLRLSKPNDRDVTLFRKR